MATGIYQIKNIVNGKVYIGQAVNINKRFGNHIYNLRNNIHSNSHLQAAYNKYGEETFTFGILTECKAEDLTRFEEYYLNQIPIEYRYNIREVADSNRGTKRSEETREKMRGRKVSSETKEKQSISLRGIPRTKEWLEKMSKGMIGKTNKAVQQIDLLTGEIIAEFESIKKASEVTGTHKNAISSAARGIYKTAGGFKWQFMV